MAANAVPGNAMLFRWKSPRLTSKTAPGRLIVDPLTDTVKRKELKQNILRRRPRPSHHCFLNPENAAPLRRKSPRGPRLTAGKTAVEADVKR